MKYQRPPRLFKIVSTRYADDRRGHKQRYDMLECGHEVQVRRPAFSHDKAAIETATHRLCKECIKR